MKQFEANYKAQHTIARLKNVVYGKHYVNISLLKTKAKYLHLKMKYQWQKCI